MGNRHKFKLEGLQAEFYWSTAKPVAGMSSTVQSRVVAVEEYDM